MKYIFWKKLEQQLALIGGFSLTGLGAYHAPYWSFIALGIIAVVGKSIFIWIEDHNNNGIVDWFEKDKY